MKKARLKLTPGQIKRIDHFLFHEAPTKYDYQQYFDSRQHWPKGGMGWACLAQGGTGILRLLLWYHHHYKPGSNEWRPKIIIKALLTHLYPPANIMNEHEYRTGLKRYANSDLSELANTLFNRSGFKPKPETLAFGVAFHTLILEPEKRQSILLAAGIGQQQMISLYVMEERLKNCTDIYTMLADAKKEQVVQWVDGPTGLLCKAKIDAIIQPKANHYVDLKTTSCTSHSAFVQSCYDYDYDRQAAFYLSSDPKASFFEFIGIQKVAPYNVYRVSFHKSHEFILYGMKKANYLLSKAKELNFVPSSWSRQEVEI
ncbi:PD-(D/E)XK nuclease-like domain-containing protein [Spirosoma migulaei]